MTDENRFEGQSRRKFLKTTGAVGVAATTGVGAFAGGATAQQSTRLNADALDFTEQTGGDVTASGLITVVAQNVDLTALQNVQVAFLNNNNILNDVTITLQNIDILNNNVVKISLTDVTVADVDVVGNQVAVNVLGFSDQNQTTELFDLTDNVQTNL